LTNIYIALTAALFTISGQVLINGYIQLWPLPVLVFFSTWGIYQLSRWRYHRHFGGMEVEKDNIYQWQDRHPELTITSIVISLAIAVATLFFLQKLTILLLLLSGLISFFYSMPRGLRKIPYIKIFLIALVWAITGSFLPAAEAGSLPIESVVLLVFSFQFLFILMITLPFDMKDIHVDEVTTTRTIPSSLGFSNTKWLVSFLFILIIYFHILLYYSKIINITSFIGLSIVLSFSLLTILFMRSDIPKWRVMLRYDGMIILLSCWIILSYYW